jgi:hypothetical protein
MDIGDWGGLVLRGGYRVPAVDAGSAQRLALFDSFCWCVEPWDAKSVEAELRKRGLTPVADNDKDFQSFHVKDHDGFDPGLFAGSARPQRADVWHASGSSAEGVGAGRH